MSIFLFPGQGAQFSGMGMDLYEANRDLFDMASKLFGSDIRKLLTADPEVLKQTDVSQVSITVVSLAAVRALSARGITADACAGFSLGEYPALAVSGVISEEDAIRLTIERGRIMQDVANQLSQGSSPESAAGMAAVLGLSPAQVDAVIAQLAAEGSSEIANIFAANYNSPVQTVISGTGEALARAETAFKEAGARRVIRLKVAGPFHSPLMAAAGERFAKVLESAHFNDPKIPLFSNVTGKRITSGNEAKKCAVAHISSPVRWTEEEASIAALMSELHSTDIIEVGPGKVLSGLWADSKQLGICKPYTEILQA